MWWWIVAFLVAMMAPRLNVSLRRQLRHAYRRWKYRPDRYDLNKLARWLGLAPAGLRDLPSPAYREARIPKRDGGFRTLEIPDPQLLLFQRTLLRRVLSGLRCHESAIGFEAGLNIVDAARPHTGKAVVIRIDIEKFFESTTEQRIRAWFRSIGWNEEAAAILTRQVTCGGHLPQGAPTSPRLSNLVNAAMDQSFANLAQDFEGSYTRYADDITLSFDIDCGQQIRGIIQSVRRILKTFGYRLQDRKTRILRSHQRQSVLGLTVNQTVGIPRATRRRLRAARHRAAAAQAEPTFSPAQLQGWESFERMVRRSR